MTSSALSAAVRRVVAGDVSALADVLNAPRDRLLEETRAVQLVVGRESVAHVLRGLVCHEIDGEGAQQWASFVRWGFAAAGGQEPVMSLPIEYEPDHEDAIAEIISRLDEIGDAIDGDIPGREEIAGYLVSLGLADETPDRIRLTPG